ncbi:Vga family ABC-F type ribosomal protection protein [Alkalicoccus halolimnae]|uniref:Vga family ABC-F type ribosomal protection protein n=1 Tax=Alkalicoccus halolimnae TaxID=1667239 RepID=A0A5C7FDB3_9BACI|nr:Vga family ABC-F type ribosomal protection protein [Alkalicoccus halolimnae]TXF85287.1 Vga family ABC-F type ribosomal protection protein [Alkalicoccus halolimnae]
MLLFEAQEIRHYVQDRLLLDIDNLQINPNDRIGLVGRNGCGKTTLLQIINGEVVPEKGTIMKNTSSELLPQLKPTDTTKSGGEITQDYIQQTLNRKAELLLADEPTTNLDTDHIEWLEKKLGEWQGAFLLVSHDRTLLDALCSTIWEIGEGKVTVYQGGYSAYTEQKKIEHRQAQLAYEKYEQEKKKLKEAVKSKEEKAQRAVKTPKNVSGSEARITGAKPYFAKKQKKLQKTAAAMETRLEKLEKVEKVKELPPLKMNLLNESAFKKRIVLRVEKTAGRIGSRILWDEISFLFRGGDKLAVIGPNGSGKTTLVKKILRQEEGITLSPSVKTGYFSQNLNILDEEKTILENVQSSSAQNETLIRTVLARMRFFNEEVHKKVNVLSGGERVKTALAKLFVSDINMLILDEPTNFLDTEALEALEKLLKDYEGSIIFVSHDRQFIENIADHILEIRRGKIKFFEGNYKDYKQSETKEKRHTKQDDYLVLETKISEVLSRLSVEPSEALEKEFHKLLKEKRELDK